MARRKAGLLGGIDRKRTSFILKRPASKKLFSPLEYAITWGAKKFEVGEWNAQSCSVDARGERDSVG